MADWKKGKAKSAEVVSPASFDVGADPADPGADKSVVTRSGGLIAKKDFVIHHNEYHRKITAGEDISDVPEIYFANLKTEGVL